MEFCTNAHGSETTGFGIVSEVFKIFNLLYKTSSNIQEAECLKRDIVTDFIGQQQI